MRRRFDEIVERFVVAQNCRLLVDFGCGNMPYRALFEPHVDHYMGVDLPGNEMAHAAVSGPNQIPLESAAADIVLSSQVLEHVADPIAYLEEAYRVLRPNGILILSTHGSWPYHPDPADYWRWTSAGLQKTLAAADFSVEYFGGVLGPAATALQLWQDAVYWRVRGFFRSTFTLHLQTLIQLADRASSDSARDEDAAVFVVVARKQSENPVSSVESREQD